MGSQQSTGASLSVTDPSFMDGLERIGGMGTFQLWKRITTGDEYEQYNIYSGQGFKFEKEIQVYEFRKKQRLNLVSVEHVDINGNPYLLQGYQQVRVFTERISLLLRDLQQLPLKYSIWILKQALVGFKALLGHFGYFPINDLMIGFNASYRVKVWISSNFASNTISGAGHTGLSGFGTDEHKMLTQLFQTVERHTLDTVDLQFFKNSRAIYCDSLTFEVAEMFLSNFCIENRIMLPHKLDFSSLLGNLRANFDRDRQHGRVAERVKTYSDASCASSSRALKFNKPEGSVVQGSAPSSKIHNTSSINAKPAENPLSFKKKHSSSVPKMTLRNNFASPVNQSKKFKFQFSHKRNQNPLPVNLVSPGVDSKNSNFEHRDAETSNFLDSFNQHVKTPTSDRKTDSLFVEKGLLSEQRGNKNILELKTEGQGKRIEHAGGFSISTSVDEKKERIKHLTASCQPPIRPIKRSTHQTCKSGLPQFKFFYHQKQTLTKDSGLISKKPMTNSILFSQQFPDHLVPTLQITTAPPLSLYKKDLSDCQATNIYNSSNSIDPTSRMVGGTFNELQSPHKTTKFEDKVLSSYLPEYQLPAKLGGFGACGLVTESIVEASPRGHRALEDRFSSEKRQPSKYSLFNEKDISLSQVVRDEDPVPSHIPSLLSPHHISPVSSFPSPLFSLGMPAVPDSPSSTLQSFFAENRLDFEKYKQIMQSCSDNQIKQSITYQQLGRMGDKSKIMFQDKYDNTPMMLDKYAKRGEVAQSMVMDESHLQVYSQHAVQYSSSPSFLTSPSSLQPMASSIIMQYTMQEIQENDGEEA